MCVAAVSPAGLAKCQGKNGLTEKRVIINCHTETRFMQIYFKTKHS